ncbi:aldo keto reductase [Colletotrichum sojae]|uniref:Aldo keto reductase n=1 Tax=Colletotrichum sojae TaxID=2175907 RepID=A0A8H6MV14_9PEZI|nr:aldo keto reductase [Colletotrichum sojae]
MATDRQVCTKTFPLNNGLSMPAVGLGTWQGRPGAEDERALISSIVHALRSGYRLVDTAQIYRVEPIVGAALRESGVPRSEVCIVTKLWGEWHHDPARALEISLAALGVEYVDVMLMHWPFALEPETKRPLGVDESPTFVETWRMMEEMVGPKCRAIGVSNFSMKTLGELLEGARVVPAVNQVEVQALHPCYKLVNYCRDKGIHVMAWGSMGGSDPGPLGELLTHDIFTGLAKAKGCSVAVVHLSWAVQRGITVIPKSQNLARLDDNIRLVTLSDEEMAIIDSARVKIGRCRVVDRLMAEVDGKRMFKNWTPQDYGWEDEEGNWLE